MTDQPTRDQLIEQAARIAALIDWNPTCLPGQHEMTIVRQVLESAGSLGLLADPEQALDLENAKGTLASVRWKLGTPEGRAVSMHAGEVRAELKKPATYREAVAAMSEDELQDNVMHTAALYGWVVVHHRPARTADGWRTAIQGQKGFPDLVLARDGRVLFRELKSAKGKPTAEQLIWLEALGDLGGIWRPDDWLSGRIQHELRRTT